jgi:hypothetical protein
LNDQQLGESLESSPDHVDVALFAFANLTLRGAETPVGGPTIDANAGSTTVIRFSEVDPAGARGAATSTGSATAYEVVEGAAPAFAPLPHTGALRLEGFLGASAPDPAVLDAAYAHLGAGEVLVCTSAAPLHRPDARDVIGTALYVAGFVQTRFRWDDQGILTVEATRSSRLPPTHRDQVLSVIVPVYNERATFDEVMTGLLALALPGVEMEILVVESNSTDGTREAALAYADTPGVQVLLEARAEGKGHAVRTGIRAATGDFVLIQDADLEYDMNDYAKLLAPLLRFETSFVLGVRERTVGARYGVRHFERQILVGKAMNVGNAIFLKLFNLAYHHRLSDPFTMYKVFRRDCVHGVILECNRFDFDWELTAKLLRLGYTPTEISVRYHSRSFDEGKKISVLVDPWTWIRACWKYRRAPLEVP